MELNSLLVPIDFSPASRSAYEQAVDLASGENPLIIALHVIDVSLVEFAAVHDLGSRDEVLHLMRLRAQQELDKYKQHVRADVEIQAIVSEGAPFLEIIRKAEEFLVDAIVMGKVGTRGKFEKLLFGTTAEKVLRGSTRPVIVLPLES